MPLAEYVMSVLTAFWIFVFRHFYRWWWFWYRKPPRVQNFSIEICMDWLELGLI